MSSNNIVVAVRVRPLNSKERNANASNIIKMSGQSTNIKYENKEHKFVFDQSLWSSDGFVIDDKGYAKPESSNYIDQRGLFDRLGKDILKNAWDGYNCTLFAYGQTGSGKTYSVMGFPENKGIIPLICEELFNGIQEKIPQLKTNEKFNVSMGILEIYNEKLRDLLNPNNKESLQIKEDVDRGFYAFPQLMERVNSYPEILKKIQMANKYRTIASTNMNETSSRAHTVVTIQFIQTLLDVKNSSTTKTSLIHLVDLAGSEKVKKSGAEGKQLFEAQNINKSLSYLGQCLQALSKKHSHVPYRNSVLTKLLMNALGGNSKTVLLVAISPSDSNYEETLSTLRFAERAKIIKTNAKINISETDKIIKHLKEENLRLIRMLKTLESKSSTVVTVENTKVIEELQAEIDRNSAEVNEISRSYNQQLEEAKAEIEKEKKEEEIHKQKLQNFPHIYNLNDDPSLNKVLVHFFDKEKTVVGNSKSHETLSNMEIIDIEINGTNILPKHAEIMNDFQKKTVTLKPINNANVYINGEKLTKDSELKHFDRILFGNSFYFFFFDPSKTNDTSLNKKEPSIDDARLEITQKSDEFKNMENNRLLEELSKFLPLVEEANSMAKEMNKKVVYNLVIFRENLPGFNYSNEAKILLHVLNTSKRNEYYIDLDDFSNRRFVMIDMYNEFVEGKQNSLEFSFNDPFFPNQAYSVCIGFCGIFLAPLTYHLNINDSISVINYKGQSIGNLSFEIVLCDNEWNPIPESDGNIKINDDVFFKITMKDFSFLQNSFIGFSKIFYKFKFEDQPFQSSLSLVNNQKSDFTDEFKFEKRKIDIKCLDYLTNEMLNVEIWGNYAEDNNFDVNDPNINKFIGDLISLVEQRKNNGHSSIKISSLLKIAPENVKDSNKSSMCTLQ